MIKYSKSRRHFLSTSTKLAGLAAATPFLMQSAHAKNTARTATSRIQAENYFLTHVRLEEGFEYQGDKIIATKTDLYTLHIKDKKIVDIFKDGTKSTEGLPVYDAKGLLMIPPLKDMHIHLDKSWYGLPWRTIDRSGMKLTDIIALEQEILPELLKTAVDRTGEQIALLNSKGTFIARSHCNVEPTSELRGLEHLLQALENNKENLSCEIVAFPQHGLLLSDSEKLMREAMKNGADYVGGIDPTNVDKDMKKSLDATFAIALDSGKGIDYHLHEGKESGIPAIEYIIERTAQEKDLQGKVTISHAFPLLHLTPEEVQPIAEKLAENQITIASTLPLGKYTMPLPQLEKAGVHLMTGTDSILDWWSPLGSGDMLERARLWAELYRARSEFGLNRALKIATAGQTPLDDKGNRIFPVVGDPADFVLLPASCTAEAVARLPTDRVAVRQGQMVFGVL